MGEINRIIHAVRTIKGICDLYSVKDFVHYDDGYIAVYNAQNDNFHYFRWSTDTNRYIFTGSTDYITNWREKRMSI